MGLKYLAELTSSQCYVGTKDSGVELEPLGIYHLCFAQGWIYAFFHATVETARNVEVSSGTMLSSGTLFGKNHYRNIKNAINLGMLWYKPKINKYICKWNPSNNHNQTFSAVQTRSLVRMNFGSFLFTKLFKFSNILGVLGVNRSFEVSIPVRLRSGL